MRRLTTLFAVALVLPACSTSIGHHKFELSKPDENGEQYVTGGECKGVTVSIGQSSGICDEGGAISDNFVSVFEAIARVAAVLLPTGVAALEDGGE